MAHPHLAETLERFEARIHRTKNRLVAIPAVIQRRLGLERRPDNDLLLVSLRRGPGGRWNHHYVKLTQDNEFAVPADVKHLHPGDLVEVKVHAVFAGVPLRRQRPVGAELLVALASQPRPGWRTDGSTRVDEYLSEDVGEGRVH
jgi:hypothetical protein